MGSDPGSREPVNPVAEVPRPCDLRGMPFSPHDPPYDQLMAAADRQAGTRPEVDRAMAREVYAEAATLLHDGLVLDALDHHDARTVVGWLAADALLVTAALFGV